MDKKNEETIARSAQAGTESLYIAGSGGATRGESETFGGQQKRNHRKNRSQSSLLSTGTTVTGGMLDHLIEEYCAQVEAKKHEIIRANEEIKRLNARIEEFKTLKKELDKQTEESE